MELKITPRELYRLGETGSCKILKPDLPSNTPLWNVRDQKCHIVGTDISVIIKDWGYVPYDDLTIGDFIDAGFKTIIPPICRQHEPTAKQMAAFNAMSEATQNDYIQTWARHTYIGWCDVADELRKKFHKDWEDRNHDVDPDTDPPIPWIVITVSDDPLTA